MIVFPSGLDELLVACATAAAEAFHEAVLTRPRAELSSSAGVGADGTDTYLLDVIVEEPVLDIARSNGANVLSEEAGWIDRGSARTLVIDPVDGTANAVQGVPLSCFAGALAIDGRIEQAVVVWFDGHRIWSAERGQAASYRTTGRDRLDGVNVSMLRPRPSTTAAFGEIAASADRIRVLGTSVLEACLVADGAIDAFCDPGGDVHRIVDLAATQLIVEAAGGVLVDALGRPFTLEPDLSLRWSGIAAATPELADEIAAIVRRSR